MSNAEWQEFVDALVSAKRCLADAWAVLDGTDGAVPEAEEALGMALAGIDAVYAAERSDPGNQDVADPLPVQVHWNRLGTLPGFALGT